MDPEVSALSGVVGTTPRRSLVWLRRTSSFSDFRDILDELLDTLQRGLDEGRGLDQPFRYLVAEQPDLTGVARPFDISTFNPDTAEPLPGDDDEDADLRDVALVVDGDQLGVDVVVRASLEGREVGRLRLSPSMERRRVRLSCGYADSHPSDPETLRLVLQRVEASKDDLRIHYRSGHTVHSGAVWSTAITPTVFQNWRWEDFDGYDPRREKPLVQVSDQQIHHAIAQSRDTSLFGWIVTCLLPDGWLTCDDDAGEVADFVHLTHTGDVTLIPVKAAGSASPARGISIDAYQEVVSQTTKNLLYVDRARLLERLRHPRVDRPACTCPGRDRTRAL